ncbi:MAG: hypothetical protein ACXW28_10500 [Thermoanaerobaculia bacterium]
MPDPLVTVTAYAAPNDARVAQGTLDSAGIPAVVDDVRERRTRVRVTTLDAIRAGDILTARAPMLTEIDEADEEEGERVCPSCGSPDITSSRRAQTFALVFTLALAIGAAAELVQAAFFAVAAAAVFFLIAGRWRCESCNETWD